MKYQRWLLLVGSFLVITGVYLVTTLWVTGQETSLPPPTSTHLITPAQQPTMTPAAPDQQPDQTSRNQKITRILDNFSSSDGTWSEEVLEGASKKIEDGQYVFTLNKPHEKLGSPIPVISHASFISFHARILALGAGEGSYSVTCHYPEAATYYEIRLQAQVSKYSIYDGEADSWLVEKSTSDLNTGDLAENIIQVLCQPGFIEVSINNNLETRVELEPVSAPGLMELHADTWDRVGSDGYSIAFDNVYASNEFYDNFTSNVHGWHEEETSDFSISIESGGNKLRLDKPNLYVWSFLPLNYAPTVVWFTATTSGVYGSYGVRCNFIDDQNFYEISFQTLTEDFTFWQVKNGEWNDLLNGKPFIPESLSPSGSTNRLQITCKPGLIQLYINDDAERQIFFEEDSSIVGETALFARTWDDLGDEGYQVVFDDVGAIE